MSRPTGEDAMSDEKKGPQPPAEAQPDWEVAPPGATHYQPRQDAYYKRVSASEWYVWSREDDRGLMRWLPSLGTRDNAEWVVRPAEAQPVDGLRVVTLSDAWDYANGRLSWNDLDARAVRCESAATPLSREHGSVQEMFNPSAPVGVEGLVRDLVREIERNTCAHEDTHRGGAIWEICDACGARWADDRGGKPDFKWPDCVERAHAWLAQQPAAVDGADAKDAEIEALQAEVERLKSMTAVTMGVGRGDGSLFVHGDYGSIKAAQALVFRAERLAEALRKLVAYVRETAHHNAPAAAAARAALRDHDQEGKDGRPD